jgi:hypothetical protein
MEKLRIKPCQQWILHNIPCRGESQGKAHSDGHCFFIIGDMELKLKSQNDFGGYFSGVVLLAYNLSLLTGIITYS